MLLDLSAQLGALFLPTPGRGDQESSQDDGDHDHEDDHKHPPVAGADGHTGDDQTAAMRGTLVISRAAYVTLYVTKLHVQSSEIGHQVFFGFTHRFNVKVFGYIQTSYKCFIAYMELIKNVLKRKEENSCILA